VDVLNYSLDLMTAITT